MKMTYPKVIIESGIEVDIDNYILSLNNAKKSFYQMRKFYLLPYIPKQKTIAGKTAYIPDVGLDIRLVEAEMKTYLKDNLKLRKINKGMYERYLQSYFKPFWKDLCTIFSNEKLSKITKVTIQVTNVGPGGR